MKLNFGFRKALSKYKFAKRREKLRSEGALPDYWVLVLGVYLADRENLVEHLVQSLERSENCVVDQKWISLFGDPPSKSVDDVTVKRTNRRTPKFALMNYLLSTTAWREYDYVILCDDDITLPDNFIDDFILAQEQLDLALAQPSRTHQSYIDHPITEQVDGLLGRETRFVEIGPITSFRKDMLELAAPFDEGAPMGWGLDFVWPTIVEEHGLRMGIVDSTPVDHSIRAPVTSYDATETRSEMAEYLRKNRHLSKEDAYTVLSSKPVSVGDLYARGPR